MADLETDKTAVVDTLTKESKVLEEPQVLLPEDSVDEKALLLVKSDQVDDTAQDTKVKSNEDSPDKESDVKIAPSPHRKIVRPKKGILKPPRPPVKPGFSGKLRDALGSIHPKFLDYAVPGGSGQVAAAAHGIAAGPVGNIASGVMEGAGVIGGAVGGAAAAVVGSWGGRFGKFVSGTSAQPNNATGATISPIQLPWKFQVPSANTKNVTTSDKPISVESSPAKPTTVPLSFTLASPSAPLPLDGTKPLKKASFILPLMSITYPISATNAPWSDKVLSDRDEIERTKNEEVKMIGAKDYWTEQKLIALYESACKGREEMVRSGIREALAHLPNGRSGSPSPKHLPLTSNAGSTTTNTYLVEPPLNKYSAEAFSDILGIEWGLSKLLLEGGIIDHDDSLKPILHALLISGTLPHLSLAGNRKIKAQGWRMVAAYIRKAKSLRFLDLSDNLIDKRSAEYIAQALMATPLKEKNIIFEAPEEPETIEKAEVEEVEQLVRRGFALPSAGLLQETPEGEDKSSGLQTLRLDGCSLRPASLDAISYSLRRSNVKNLSIRRNRIPPSGAVAVALMIRDYPDSNVAGPSSSTQPINGNTLFTRLNQDMVPNEITYGASIEATSPLHTRQGRPLETEKLGPLVTLDVKGNELRGGVTYIAQVLKRNRTLKVLNLSDNKIDATGLQSIAQALKTNETLDTLDLSNNPCCGAVEGVLALRSALAKTTALRRLYLGSTGMSTEAAIAFAEGLHEAGHILHIDLTGNPAIDADGVAALTVGMRANGIIRCLDMTLQHADKSQAELAQSLMQCCIRNTETAVKARGEKISQAVQDAMWSPIQNSTLVRQAKEYETLRNMEAVRKTVDTPAGLARNEVYELDPNAVLHACEEVAEYLHKFVAQYATGVVNPTERQRAIGAVEQAKALLERVGDLIQDTEDAIRMERLLAVNDLLAPLIIGAEDILTAARRSTAVQTTLPSAQRPTGPLMSRPPSSGPASRRHMRVPSLEISSPNFSITNSDDDDSDAEELASAGGIAPVKQTTPANLPAIKKKPIDLNGLSLGILNARTRLEPSMSESSPGSTVLPPDVQVHTYETPPSPLERVNKDWLEEEGEIFRKGFKLRVAEEIEERDDKLESGSDLKQKILEIEVARTPHRPVEHALQHDDDDTSDSDDD